MSPESEEEMEGTEEGVEEESSAGSPSSSAPPPSSPPGLQKRPLSSTSSHSSPPSDLLRRKTRDLPNIYNCHSCGLRFPDRGRRERLQPLDSQWRIVLLCRACLQAVRSAEVCSYCFGNSAEEKEGFISCRRCSARVHLNCLPRQRGFLTASDLDPGSFLCVDCCALPRSPNKRPSIPGDSCAARVAAAASLDDVVRDAKLTAEKKMALAVQARERALAKAVAAKRAKEQARNALDLVVVAEKKPLTYMEATVPDKELALRLHRAMNGSQRVSRNALPESSDRPIDGKRGRFSANLLGTCDIYGKVELCTEDTLSETMETTDAKLMNLVGASEGNSLVPIDMRQGKEVDENITVNPVVTPASEEGSDMLLKSAGNRNSVDSVLAGCPSTSGPNTSSLKQDERCYMPDRYMKKYCKRPSRMKDRKENRGSASLLVPVSL